MLAPTNLGPANVRTVALPNTITAQPKSPEPTKSQVQDAAKTKGAADAKKEASTALKFWDSHFMATCNGLICVVVGFVLSWGAQCWQKRRENNTRYRCLLESVANELDFYADKFNFLSAQISTFLAERRIIPSYKFYPSFLEQGKLRLNEFMRNSDLVKQVGHCHFELGHICERMEIFRRECDVTNPLPMANAIGFKRLVDSNIPVFKTTADALRKEAKTLGGERQRSRPD